MEEGNTGWVSHYRSPKSLIYPICVSSSSLLFFVATYLYLIVFILSFLDIVLVLVKAYVPLILEPLLKIAGELWLYQFKFHLVFFLLLLLSCPCFSSSHIGIGTLSFLIWQ